MIALGISLVIGSLSPVAKITLWLAFYIRLFMFLFNRNFSEIALIVAPVSIKAKALLLFTLIGI